MDTEQTRPERDIADDYFISKWPDWIRWGVMIPAALLGCILVAGVFKFLMIGADESTWRRVWTDIMQSALVGFLFVTIAAYIAPKKQVVVAVVFLSVVVLLVGSLVTINLLFTETGNDKLYNLLHEFLLIAGAAIGVFLVKSELDKR